VPLPLLKNHLFGYISRLPGKRIRGYKHHPAVSIRFMTSSSQQAKHMGFQIEIGLIGVGFLFCFCHNHRFSRFNLTPKLSDFQILTPENDLIP